MRKITYWFEIARQQGRDPQAEMVAVMQAVGWGGTMKGELTAKAMVRNRVIAERLHTQNQHLFIGNWQFPTCSLDNRGANC